LLFDEYGALYQYYTVDSTEFHLVVIDNGSSPAAIQWELAVAPSFSSSDFTSSDPEHVGEQPDGHWQLIYTHTGNPAVNSFHRRYNTLGLMGVPRSMLHASNLAPAITGNPSWTQYLHICGQVVDESTTMANVYVYVEIDYHVTFFIRQPISGS
jgi:hypothetical protein